jgi:hypothetical protein
MCLLGRSREKRAAPNPPPIVAKAKIDVMIFILNDSRLNLCTEFSLDQR